MSLAAVPAYLLARMFVSRRASVVVAAMTLLVPSMAYTGVVMTENACYPVFLLSVWLIARAVRRPTLGAQALALLGLGLLAFTRIQGAALVGAYVVAIGVYALTGPRARAVVVPASVRALPGVRRVGLARAVRRLGRAWGRAVRLARRPLRHVRRAAPLRGAAVVGVSGRGPRVVRRRSAGRCDGDRGRPGVRSRCPGAHAAVHRGCGSDVRGHAALRLDRQRFSRCRRDGEPQRALRLLRRSAPVRRARSLGTGGPPPPTTLGPGHRCGVLHPDCAASDRSTRLQRGIPVAGAASVAQHRHDSQT